MQPQGSGVVLFPVYVLSMPSGMPSDIDPSVSKYCRGVLARETEGVSLLWVNSSTGNDLMTSMRAMWALFLNGDNEAAAALQRGAMRDAVRH